MNKRLKHRNQRKNEKLARSGAMPAPARARRERGAARHETRVMAARTGFVTAAKLLTLATELANDATGLQAAADRWNAELAQDMGVLRNAAAHEAQQSSLVTVSEFTRFARELLGDGIEPLPEPARPTTIRVEREEPLLKVDISTLKTAEEAIAECLAPVREAMEECAQIMKSYKPPTPKSAATPTPPALQLPAFTKPATPPT